MTTGDVLAARIPAGANVVYDELAVYGRALSRAGDRCALRRLRQLAGQGADERPGGPRRPGDRALLGPAHGPGARGPELHRPLRARDQLRRRRARGQHDQRRRDEPQRRRRAGGLVPRHGPRDQRLRRRRGGERRHRDVRRGRPTSAPSATTTPSSTGAWASTTARSPPTAPATATARSTRARAPTATATARSPTIADGAKTDGRAWYSSSYDLLRAPLATGMPTGDRTVEAWIWSDNAGARPIAYGDFSFEVAERGITVGGTTLSLPPDGQPPPDGLALAPRRGHGGGDDAHRRTSTAPPSPPRRRPSARSPPANCSARASPRARPSPTTRSPSTRARSAPSASRRTSTPPSTRSRRSPQGLQADTSQANTLTLYYYGSAGCYCAPLHQSLVDRYVAEAWRGDQLIATQSIADGPGYATFSGLPAGAYTLKVRAVQRLRRRAGGDDRRDGHGRRHHLPADRPGRPPRALLAPRRDERHRRHRQHRPRPPGGLQLARRPAHPLGRVPDRHRRRDGRRPRLVLVGLRPDPRAAGRATCRPATARSRRGSGRTTWVRASSTTATSASR